MNQEEGIRDPERESAYASFESMGEAEVRQKIKIGHIYGKKKRYADSWLGEFEADALARAEAREEESLSIARSALSISKDDNRISSKSLSVSLFARNMSIIAMVMTIITTIVDIKGLIEWLSF